MTLIGYPVWRGTFGLGLSPRLGSRIRFSGSYHAQTPESFYLKPLDLIASAQLLVQSSRGKPSQVNLRRAISSAYYALFHRLARSCADLLVGGEGAAKSKHAWRQTYRALNHGTASDACKQRKMLALFPKGIEDFGHAFVSMQEKRHAADYDPHERFSKSEVLADIQIVEQAIGDFEAEDAKDRQAFCAFVLFKKR